MAVDKLNLQALTTAFSKHQRHMHILLVILLALYLLALSADLIWRIIPEPVPASQNFTTIQSSSITAQNSTTSNTSVRALQNLHLFGKLVKEVAQVTQQVVSDAPVTRLNLTLSGVVASSSPDLGAAIIENRGAQNTYGVGEKIEGTNATLRQVQRDRVIIRNGVRDETLMLQGVDFDEANRERQQLQLESVASQPQRTASSNEVVGPQAIKKRESKPVLSREAIAATQQLRDAPDSFIDFISVSPYRENNQILGYRVSPGKNPTLFTAVGLQQGDVITQINGLNVTSFEALNALRSSESLELTLTRKDEVVTLYLELPGSSEI